MIKNIIFDFDGVILDSVPVKTEAFRLLFKAFEKTLVDEFIAFHLRNGGKSRYVKIKYFFEELLSQKISDEDVSSMASQYSELTKTELAKEKYIIQDAFEFIQQNYQKYNMHIASGADEKDLKYICDTLNLSQYFLSINGSPTIKDEIVTQILNDNHYTKDETILIGDSINDFQAADLNGVKFYGYNNLELSQDHQYLNSFSKINFT